MALLVTCTVCGILAVSAALILQFSLPGWLFFAGLHRANPDRLSRIEVPRLRRRLSIIFYFLASGFLAVALFLYIRLLPSDLAIPLLIALAAVSFNLVWFVFRRMDGTEYSEIARLSGRVYLVAVNVALVVLLVLSLVIR